MSKYDTQSVRSYTSALSVSKLGMAQIIRSKYRAELALNRMIPLTDAICLGLRLVEKFPPVFFETILMNDDWNLHIGDIPVKSKMPQYAIQRAKFISASIKEKLGIFMPLYKIYIVSINMITDFSDDEIRSAFSDLAELRKDEK